MSECRISLLYASPSDVTWRRRSLGFRAAPRARTEGQARENNAPFLFVEIIHVMSEFRISQLYMSPSDMTR